VPWPVSDFKFLSICHNLAPLIVPMIDFIQSARGSRRALRLGGPRIAAEAARRLAEFQKPAAIAAI